MTQLDHDFLDRLEEYGPIARTLSMCLRPTFCAEHDTSTLVWGDWSSIEARVLPWLANSRGSQKVLDVFAQVDADPNAPDIYMIAAGHLYNIDPSDINERYRDGDKEAGYQRLTGKVQELSLGFGGGVGALMGMATNYGIHFEEAHAGKIVEVWRENNAWARNFWDALKEAFFSAYENPGVGYPAGRVAYMFDPDYHGGTIFCALPDGRLLTYPNLKFREVEREDRKTGEKYMSKVLTYRKGYKWGAIWHGILAENPTQGAAASVLRAKLRVLENETQRDIHDGYDPLLLIRGHTHDEIITETHEGDVDEARAHLKRVMEEPLPWTEGLPLVAEVTDNWYYTKAKD